MRPRVTMIRLLPDLIGSSQGVLSINVADDKCTRTRDYAVRSICYGVMSFISCQRRHDPGSRCRSSSLGSDLRAERSTTEDLERERGFCPRIEDAHTVWPTYCSPTRLNLIVAGD